MNGRISWYDSLLGVPPAAPAPAPAYPRLGRSLGLLGLGYFALALLSLYVSRQPGSIATIWFANALAVAYLLFAPRAQRWPLWGAVAAANLAANLVWNQDLALALSLLPTNLVEMMLAVTLLRRAGAAGYELRSPGQLLSLLARGGLWPQLVGATLGAATLGWHGLGEFAVIWLNWFEGSVIGATSVLPLAFLGLRTPWSTLRPQLLDWRTLALLPVLAGLDLLALAYLPFPFIYVSLPLLLAATLVEPAAVALLTLASSLTIAAAIALGILVPPPFAADWQQSFLYLAYAAALVPAQVVGAAVAAMRDGRRHLEQRTRQLELANERLEQFARIASHDLREPLNTVAQFGSLLDQDCGAVLPPEGHHYLRLMQQATSRMRRLLDDVLLYSRVQGAEPGPMQPVNLQATVEEIRDSLAARIAGTGATLQIGPLPTVTGQPSLLSLLFQNLVANALKFVPPGRPPIVEVQADVHDDEVVVTVKDNGIGIAAEDLPRLFRPFQRLHTRRQYEGTGLGLSLCRHIVEVHGGRIQVESEPGAGSRFHVHLPRRRA